MSTPASTHPSNFRISAYDGTVNIRRYVVHCFANGNKLLLNGDGSRVMLMEGGTITQTRVVREIAPPRDDGFAVAFKVACSPSERTVALWVNMVDNTWFVVLPIERLFDGGFDANFVFPSPRVVEERYASILLRDDSTLIYAYRAGLCTMNLQARVETVYPEMEGSPWEDLVRRMELRVRDMHEENPMTALLNADEGGFWFAVHGSIFRVSGPADEEMTIDLAFNGENVPGNLPIASLTWLRDSYYLITDNFYMFSVVDLERGRFVQKFSSPVDMAEVACTMCGAPDGGVFVSMDMHLMSVVSRSQTWPGFSSVLFYKEMGGDRAVYLENVRRVLTERMEQRHVDVTRERPFSMLFYGRIFNKDVFERIIEFSRLL